MFRFSIGHYELACQEGLPDLVSFDQERAALCEQFQAEEQGRGTCFVSVTRRGEAWPNLLVIQEYAPAGIGFAPGLLIVPETDRLFLGAGTRLLAYDLLQPVRLWEDQAECGFGSWSRYGDFILMSAELELACWTIEGTKLWTTFADPPHEYRVEGSHVVLSNCDSRQTLDLATGRLIDRSAGPH